MEHTLSPKASLVVIGLLFVGGLFLLQKIKEKDKITTPVLAMVTDIHGNTVDFEFHTKEGVFTKATANRFSDPCDALFAGNYIGQELIIRYNKSNPEEAYLNDELPMFIFIYPFLLVLISMFFYSLSALVGERDRKFMTFLLVGTFFFIAVGLSFLYAGYNYSIRYQEYIFNGNDPCLSGEWLPLKVWGLPGSIFIVFGVLSLIFQLVKQKVVK